MKAVTEKINQLRSPEHRSQRAMRIKRARLHCYLSKEKMAAGLGITPATYRRIEEGESEPKATTVELIAEITKVPREWLFFADSSKLSHPQKCVLEGVL
ncbi:helix-turn-helix domain-containing protein [Vibrio marisflavi]|uniref:HTH cro/C1-type domain-containing protein n=1 Tax=Vibrio marisflavi CECT 7928 TaxID=634439 RepID=A0ABM9AB86_9VIBR|nr:helix-turn-helix transcriptional regulator [Vibrio marisflavi]CAH0543144.1 hypothetical protein VMF7928_04422 [Vibrio marisflavi CECT 7928]